jgi:hypothetical protein
MNVLAGASLAQQLHEKGVPVVVGSQIPLTQPGSVIITQLFYDRLLDGWDVRRVLHEVRTTLYERRDVARNDWAGLVAYVTLPEAYSQYLDEVALRADLGMLESIATAAPAEHVNVDELLRERIRSLNDRLAEIPSDRRAEYEECIGLLASAHKRLAEHWFKRACELGGSQGESLHEVSRELLKAAYDYYRKGYRAGMQSHWLGVQKLSLEAVIYGRLEESSEWYAARQAALFDRDEGRNAYWAHASLAELYLLAPFRGTGQSIDLAPAREALCNFKQTKPADDAFALETTRRQLGRYVSWWPTQQAFYPHAEDTGRKVAEAARELIRVLG